MENIIKQLEKLAKTIDYGSIKIELTVSRGVVVKMIVKEREKIILFDRKN